MNGCANSKPFSEYVSRIVELHRLIANGSDEGAEGESLRDEMDQWWHQLTTEEIEQVGRLSEDLYHVIESAAASVPFKGELWHEIETQMTRGNWFKALEIIHQHRSEMPVFMVGFLEGLSWAELGEWNVAKLFFSEAYRRQPNIDDLAICLLSAAVRAGATPQDAQLAQEVAAITTDPATMLKAAEVVESAADRFVDPNTEQLKVARGIAQKGIEMAESAGLEGNLRRQVVHAYLGIALTDVLFGKYQEARVACQRALQLDPSDVDVFMVAGFLNADDITLRNAETRYHVSQRLRETTITLLPSPERPPPSESLVLN